MHELPEVRHRPRPGSIFLGLLVVTIVGTAGYLLGSLRAGGEPKLPAQPIAEESRRDPDWVSTILSELAALREEVRQAKVATTSRMPVTAASAPEAEPRADIARLDAAIARLEARTNLSAQAARSPVDPQLLERLARESIRFEWNAIDGFTDGAGFEKWSQAASEELTRSHGLWTLEDTLQAYGSPHSFRGSMGNRTVTYAVRALDSETSVLVRFWFEGDRVTVVQVETGSPG